MRVNDTKTKNHVNDGALILKSSSLESLISRFQKNNLTRSS